MLSKITAVLLVVLLTSGCSVYRSAEMTPEQVQQKVTAGELAAVGDKIRATTTGGEVHLFRVTEVTAETILGERVSVPINEVMTIETLEFSAGRTAATVGGGIALWIIILSVGLSGAFVL